MSLEIDILRDEAEVHALSAAWDDLVDRSPCNRAFSSSTWFRNSVAGRQIRVFTARRDGQLVGILPLVRHGKGLSFSSDLADYHDLIATRQDAEACRVLLNHANECLNLNGLHEHGNLGTVMDHPVEPNCHHIALPESFEAFVAERPYKFRKELRYVTRRAEQAGVHVRELTAHDQADIAEIFLALHLARLGPHSCFHKEEHAVFVKKTLPTLLAQGRMRALAIFAEDKPIAIDLYMVGASSLCCWNGGFLEEAGRWSPGKLLLIAACQAAIATGLFEIDLMRGNQPWKTKWSTGMHAMGKMAIYSTVQDLV